MNRAILMTSFLALTLVSACRTVPISNPNVSLSPPPNASLEDIGQAIVAAGTGLGWAIQLEEPGKARGTLHLRDHEAVVEITYTKQKLQINYAGSTNLLQAGDDIHRNYNRWVKNLRVQIQRRVVRLS